MKRKLISKIALSTMLASSLYASQSLDDVIITAKSNNSSLDTAGTFTVITKEDIAQSHASTVQDLLEESTGVTLATSNDGRKKVSIRGLDDIFTLILIDGKKVSNVDAQISYGDFAFEFISLDMIEKIEIGKGPMSTLYGSGAIGGVINIITKKPTDELSGSINIDRGTSSGEGGDETNINANINTKVSDNLYLGLSASKKKSELIVDKDDSTETIFEAREVVNLGLNAKYNIDDTQSISASFLKSSDTRDTATQDSYYETDNKQYSLDYNKNFENITLDVKAYRTKTDTHTTFSNGFTHELVNDTFNTEAKFDTFKNHFIVAGLELKQDSYDRTTDAGAEFDKKTKQYASYLQDDISITDDTTLTLGARYDKHEDFDAEISPKVYLTYKLTQDSRLKGGYAEGFLAPTISQSTDEYQAIMKPGGPISLIFNGNSDLKAQTGKTYELSYEYDNKDLLFKSTLFYNDIKDFIDSTRISKVGLTSTYEYQNVSNAKTKGIELELAKKDIIFSNLDASIGYTYLNTKNEDTDESLNMKPKHKINAKVDYLFPQEIKSTLKYELYGTQYNEDEDKNVGSYSLVDFGLSKKFANNVTAKIGVNNLFNKELNSDDTEYGYQVRPRFYYIGLSYRF